MVMRLIEGFPDLEILASIKERLRGIYTKAKTFAGLELHPIRATIRNKLWYR
jgi:hypothetical protein